MKGKIIYVDFTKKHQQCTSKKRSIFSRIFYYIKFKFRSRKYKWSSQKVVHPFKRIL